MNNKDCDNNNNEQDDPPSSSTTLEELQGNVQSSSERMPDENEVAHPNNNNDDANDDNSILAESSTSFEEEEIVFVSDCDSGSCDEIDEQQIQQPILSIAHHHQQQRQQWMTLREELEQSKQLQNGRLPEELLHPTDQMKASPVLMALREELEQSKQLQNGFLPEGLLQQYQCTNGTKRPVATTNQSVLGSQKSPLREELEQSKQLQNGRLPEELQQQTTDPATTPEALMAVWEEMKQSKQIQNGLLSVQLKQQAFDAVVQLIRTNQVGCTWDEEEGRRTHTEDSSRTLRVSNIPLHVQRILGLVRGLNSRAVNLPGAYRRKPGGHSSLQAYMRDDSAVVIADNDNIHSTRFLACGRLTTSDIWRSIVNAEELHPKDSKKLPAHAQRFLRLGFLAVFVVVVVTIGVTIILTLPPNARVHVVDICGHATLVPTITTMMMRETFGIRDAIVKVVGPDVFTVEYFPSLSMSSYCHALHWITINDPQQLTPNDPSLIQRFIAAYLYFTMTNNNNNNNNNNNSSKSLPSCSPPRNPWSDSAGCMWRSVVDYAEPRQYRYDAKSAWLSNTPECTWGGISCSSQQQIIGLQLNGIRTWEGAFPAGVRHLPFLQAFSFAGNDLTGTLPNELMEIKSHITEFRLDFNAFTGSIPVDWWAVRRMRQFSVGANQFTGSIPSSVGKLVDIKTFKLLGNHFTNVLPDEIGNMSSVAIFNCGDNALQGTFPKSSKHWNQLFWLDTTSNHFTGQLPSNFYRKLGRLYMGGNQFTGTIPEAIYSFPKLRELDLSHNSLTGTLSSSVGRLSQYFNGLYLNGNHFNGTIPAEISELTGIARVYLQDNDFTGSIPERFCALKGGNVLEVLEADCTFDEETDLVAELHCAESCCTRCYDA